MSKGYSQIKRGNRTCQEIYSDHISEQLQGYYLDRYEGFQAEMHHVSQFDVPKVQGI